MDPFTIIIGAILFVMLLKLSGKSRNARLLDQLHGPEGYPIAGNAFDFMGPRESKKKISKDATLRTIH